MAKQSPPRSVRERCKGYTFKDLRIVSATFDFVDCRRKLYNLSFGFGPITGTDVLAAEGRGSWPLRLASMGLDESAATSCVLRWPITTSILSPSMTSPM